MKKSILSMCLVSAIALSGCQTLQSQGDKQLIGTGAGAVAGGLLGSTIGGGSGQKWAIGAGVLLGSLMGSEIGASLDKADMAYANQANQQAYSAPVGETISWNNPQTGNYGTVKPVRDGYSQSGDYCREYQQTVVVGGQEQSAYGTACRRPDGSWEIVN